MFISNYYITKYVKLFSLFIYSFSYDSFLIVALTLDLLRIGLYWMNWIGLAWIGQEE